MTKKNYDLDLDLNKTAKTIIGGIIVIALLKSIKK